MFISKINKKFFVLCFLVLLTTSAIIVDRFLLQNSSDLIEKVNDNTNTEKVLFEKDIGVADFWLKKYIIKEIPALSYSSISDWEKVNLLRDWAAKNVSTATIIEPLESEYGYSVYNESAAQLLARQMSGEGGFYCAGVAVTTAKIFQLFGYPAISYNMVFWFEDDVFASHVVTLVKIKYKGKDLITVQDAYFNYTVTYVNNNKPVDIFDMLELLSNKKIENLTMSFSSGTGKLYLSQKNSKPEKATVSWEKFFKNSFTGGLGKGVELKTGETNYLYYFLSPDGMPTDSTFKEVYLKAREAYKKAFGEVSTQ